MPYYRRSYRYGYLGLFSLIGRAIGVLFIAAVLGIIALWSFIDGNEPPPAATTAPPAVASTTGGQ